MEKTEEYRYFRGYRQSHKEQLRQEAEERQAVRDALSDEAQIKVLDRRLGDGVGAKKERIRLGDPRFCILEE